MSSPPSTARRSRIVELADWLSTPAGQYLLAWESQALDAAVADVFGFHAMQAGLPGLHALRNSRMQFLGCVSPLPLEQLGPAHAPLRHRYTQAELHALPFESQSLDLLVLPHGLELAADPHAVLREAARVLIPEGRLIITGLQPWSLWGLRHLARASQWPPGCQRLISPARLLDWLQLLSFAPGPVQYGGYALPRNSVRLPEPPGLLDRYGPRLWPVCGGFYLVSAIKRQNSMRLITPGWRRRQNRRQRRAAAAAAPLHASPAPNPTNTPASPPPDTHD